MTGVGMTGVGMTGVGMTGVGMTGLKEKFLKRLADMYELFYICKLILWALSGSNRRPTD
jgi:hypothetical protein